MLKVKEYGGEFPEGAHSDISDLWTREQAGVQQAKAWIDARLVPAKIKLRKLALWRPNIDAK